MAIRPVTYQGASNYKSNLYALEVKSRFIDQTKADGYYKGYGHELSAIVSGNIVTIQSGAFLVQGRLNEIEGVETITVPVQDGYVGYIIARIETYHPEDTENCTIIARNGTTLEAISLSRDDTYQRAAESENKVYELPIYSYEILNGTVINLVKLITPVEENTTTRDIANGAVATANTASQNASAAVSTANTANATANTASQNASAAVIIANGAVATANTASQNASAAVSTANSANTKAKSAVNMANAAEATANAAEATAHAAETTANEAKAEVEDAIAAAARVMYPVGSIYMSVNSTSPSSIFGGTWTAWGDGRVPVGINAGDNDFNTAEKTGGEKKHTLSILEMPQHTHGITFTMGTAGTGTLYDYIYGKKEYSATNLVNSESKGGGMSHNNLQPYIVCYMWKRIA